MAGETQKLAKARLDELAAEATIIYTIWPELKPGQRLAPSENGSGGADVEKPLHWTQRPENKARLRRMRRKQARNGK